MVSGGWRMCGGGVRAVVGWWDGEERRGCGGCGGGISMAGSCVEWGVVVGGAWCVVG